MLSISAGRILTHPGSRLCAGPGHGMVKGRGGPTRTPPGVGGTLTSQAQNVPRNGFSLIAGIFVEACGARGGRGVRQGGGHAGLLCNGSHTGRSTSPRWRGTMSPRLPPHALYRGARPGPAAARVRWAAARGSGGVGSTMRQGWAGHHAHHRLPARPGGFQELGAVRAAQPGNRMGCQGGGEWVPAPGSSWGGGGVGLLSGCRQGCAAGGCDTGVPPG